MTGEEKREALLQGTDWSEDGLTKYKVALWVDWEEWCMWDKLESRVYMEIGVTILVSPT